MIRMSHTVEGPILFVFLCNLGLQGKVLKFMKNAQLAQSAFSRLGHFPQVCRQVKQLPILELHEMIRVPHVVVCPICFYFVLLLIYD